MNTAIFDFKGSRAVRRGATYHLFFTFKQPNGFPINFAGCSVVARFKKSLPALTGYDFVVQISDPPSAGRIALSIPASLTANLPTGRYVWDMLVTQSNQELWRAVEGELHLVGGVS
jgi:hypothetical protein